MLTRVSFFCSDSLVGGLTHLSPIRLLVSPLPLPCMPYLAIAGCTNQACGFRDIYQEFVSAGYDMYCPSADTSAAQSKWQTEVRLLFSPSLFDQCAHTCAFITFRKNFFITCLIVVEFLPGRWEQGSVERRREVVSLSSEEASWLRR